MALYGFFIRRSLAIDVKFRINRFTLVERRPNSLYKIIAITTILVRTDQMREQKMKYKLIWPNESNVNLCYIGFALWSPVDLINPSVYIQCVADSNRRRLRSSSSSQLAIRRTRLSTADERRSCVSGGWKPSLEQSAARRHLRSNAVFFGTASKLISFPDHFLPVFGF